MKSLFKIVSNSTPDKDFLAPLDPKTESQLVTVLEGCPPEMLEVVKVAFRVVLRTAAKSRKRMQYFLERKVSRPLPIPFDSDTVDLGAAPKGAGPMSPIHPSEIESEVVLNGLYYVKAKLGRGGYVFFSSEDDLSKPSYLVHGDFTNSSPNFEAPYIYEIKKGEFVYDSDKGRLLKAPQKGVSGVFPILKNGIRFSKSYQPWALPDTQIEVADGLDHGRVVYKINGEEIVGDKLHGFWHGFHKMRVTDKYGGNPTIEGFFEPFEGVMRLNPLDRAWDAVGWPARRRMYYVYAKESDGTRGALTHVLYDSSVRGQLKIIDAFAYRDLTSGAHLLSNA